MSVRQLLVHELSAARPQLRRWRRRAGFKFGSPFGPALRAWLISRLLVPGEWRQTSRGPLQLGTFGLLDGTYVIICYSLQVASDVIECSQRLELAAAPQVH